jgi:peptidoglycan/LPS O-acetylase OafA/YrhL
VSELEFWINTASNYVSFGLALYAIGNVLALVWHCRNNPESQLPVVDLARAGICVIALLLMEAGRQFWDSYHVQHFPLWITRLALPAIYLMLGNSILRQPGKGSINQPTQAMASESSSG